MWTVLRDFRDIEDNHLYVVGDQYPHDGREVDRARIEALETGQNAAGMRLIRPDGINIKPEEKPARKARKTQKKGA